MNGINTIIWVMEQMNVPTHIQNAIYNLLKPYESDIEFEISKKKKKRTLTQNTYYWKLLGELAKVLKVSNEELHSQLIKRYSHNINYISCLSEVNLEEYGIKYYEIVRKYEDKDKLFTTYKIYQPSSEMNTLEFTDLVDGLISECQEVGIQTLTPNELNEMRMLEKEAG